MDTYLELTARSVEEIKQDLKALYQARKEAAIKVKEFAIREKKTK